MNLPDGKQLVRESSGNIEEQQNKRNMGLHAKLAWITLFFCLGLIALAHCVPVEVIYTGEGCACPTKLDFSVNVPNLPKPRKYYMPYDYGYKVEVPPRQAKAKVSYSFDFTVEEPRPPPKQRRPCSNQDLYAKVDRVAVKKGDCEDSYAAPTTAPSNCRCGQCGITKPLYRYVFDNMSPPPLPCKCRRPNCKCNLSRATSTAYSPNAIFMLNQPVIDLMSEPNPLVTGGDEGDEAYVNSNGSGGMEVGAGNIRRKRDLQRTLFRPRKLAKERQGRFMKLYHKNLSDRPHRLFDLEGLSNRQRQSQRQGEPKKAKRKVQRKAKKTRYTHKRTRLVKRDIKGEYELLEKEREQMDLTLPEIIQFMPETLQPDFKRGQCYFGCGSQQPDLRAKSTENDPSKNPTSTEYSINSQEIHADNPDVTITYTDTNSSKERAIDMSMDVDTYGEAAALNENSNINTPNTNTSNKQYEKEPLKETKDSAQQNFITSSYKKRNAANYFNGRSTPTTDSAQKQRAYHAQTATAQPIFTDPNYTPHQSTYARTKTAQSAAPVKSTVTAKVPAPLHIYDHLGRKYSENNDHLRAVTTISVPDPLDHNATPLRYAGDLEIPPARYDATYTQYGGGGGGMPPTVHAEIYPVQHISNEQLDKIISDIVFRHPEFIDATKHFAGALVDPEPLQEMETISFLKKLIDGRLNLWFGQEDEYNPPQYSTSYSSDPHDYSIPQLHDLLPPLY